MRRRTKLLIAIIIVIIIGLVAFIGGTMMLVNDSKLVQGNRTILVCAIDESETRPGMGACDMAFLVYLNNGSITNYTPVYPGGVSHPSAAEPAEAQAQGAGSKLLLHDSFWWADFNKSANYAKEIVEHKYNVSIDAVVAVNSQALDAILGAAGTVNINGTNTTVKGIDIIREDQYDNGNTRGDAVMDMVKACAKATKNPTVKANMVQAAVDQYNKGNIKMIPANDFMGLLAAKGIDMLFK
ncbi:MAG: DUF4012 domain-containing protein [Methanobrevibacter sp.]|nr:DUF4012 domain-containing protein [Methanobrevibacter sp.]